MSFTPGPWKVRKTFYGETYIEDKDGYYVCAFPVCSPNKKDVVMIAAAPEMLELLRQAWIEMDNAVQTYIPICKDGEDMAELCGKIETLIDRIDGEEGTNA